MGCSARSGSRQSAQYCRPVRMRQRRSGGYNSGRPRSDFARPPLLLSSSKEGIRQLISLSDADRQSGSGAPCRNSSSDHFLLRAAPSLDSCSGGFAGSDSESKSPCRRVALLRIRARFPRAMRGSTTWSFKTPSQTPCATNRNHCPSAFAIRLIGVRNRSFDCRPQSRHGGPVDAEVEVAVVDQRRAGDAVQAGHRKRETRPLIGIVTADKIADDVAFAGIDV